MIWNEILCLGDSITYGAIDEFGRSPTIELSKIMKKSIFVTITASAEKQALIY